MEDTLESAILFLAVLGSLGMLCMSIDYFFRGRRRLKQLDLLLAELQDISSRLQAARERDRLLSVLLEAERKAMQTLADSKTTVRCQLSCPLGVN